MERIRKILIGFGFVFILYAIIIFYLTQYNFGILVVLYVGFLLMMWGVFYQTIQNRTKHGLPRLIKYLAYAGMLGFCFMIGFLAYEGQQDTATYQEEAVIVLGAGLRGTKVSKTLQLRLDTAVEYHQKNPDALIVVSGGKGPQERRTEASAMEDYLIAQGIAPNKIVTEEQAASTFENFQFSKDILKKEFPNGYTAAYITNGFHIYRAEQLAKLVGMCTTHLHAGQVWYTALPDYFREVFALGKFWVFKN